MCDLGDSMSNADFSLYEKDPTNAENLLKLSRECADRSENDSALLFAEQVLRLSNLTNEQRIEALERCSILGFYSKVEDRKQQGRLTCEILSTDRTVPWSTRNTARMNHTWYARFLKEIMPSTELKHVDFTPEEKYSPMNPSIYQWNNELWLIQRTVNYIITPSGHYDMQGDDAIKTRNYLLKLNPDLSIESAKEILLPTDLPPPMYNLVLGFEDCRLFAWKDSLWATSTCREQNQHGNCEIMLAKITPTDGTHYRFSDWRVIHPQGLPLAHQKNWMPLVINNDTLRFVYSSDPVRIIDDQGKTVSLEPTNLASDSFRGGSQAIKFDNGWLAIIHESHCMTDGRRKYTHRFVFYNDFFELAAYSESFFIHSMGIEFAAGIAVNPYDNKIVVSFGLADKDSFMVSISADDIRRCLKPVKKSDLKLKQEDIDWIESQANTALKDTAAIERATTILNNKGFYQHEDKVKNWDNLIALYYAIKETKPDEHILDVGATVGSAFLPTLHKLGYGNLVSVNLSQPTPEIIKGVAYLPGDATKTDFKNDYFGFISCLSVIEHGVDVVAFFKESARILKPGGHLFVSTDYWYEPVDTMGQTAFGAPVKVFDSAGIDHMVKIAEAFGLALTSKLDSTCNEKTVNWIGMDYTFISLLFVKV